MLERDGLTESVNLSASRSLWERARKTLAGGVSTGIRAAERPHPLFFDSGGGARLRDVDGNEFLDYVGGYGPVLLGHGHPAVAAAMHERLLAGHQFGGQTRLEVEVAERLARLLPCFDVVRFNCSGSEAVSAALRLARAYTGGRLVVRFEGHYHGWLDEELVSDHPEPEWMGPYERPLPVLPSDGELPTAADHLLVLPRNDLKVLDSALARYGDQVAAILTEPVMCNNGGILPRPGYLEGLRQRCSQRGVVLNFDEVITGFRLGLGGAQALFGVTPDLAVMSKAMANGVPISCVGGRRDVMEIATRGVVHAGTFNGNAASVAAALAMLDVLERGGPELYANLFRRSRRLMDGLRAAAADAGCPVLVQGPGPVSFTLVTPRPEVRSYRDLLDVDTAVYGRFCAAMLAQRIRLIPAGRWYVSLAHTDEDVEQTVAAAGRAWQHAAATGYGR